MHLDLFIVLMREFCTVLVPLGKYWCMDCGRQGVASPQEGAECMFCGAEQWEPFRVGWDESD